jgi:hypothetical protein
MYVFLQNLSIIIPYFLFHVVSTIFASAPPRAPGVCLTFAKQLVQKITYICQLKNNMHESRKPTLSPFQIECPI